MPPVQMLSQADQIEIENGAGVARVTCGWKLPHLDLAQVRPYWRDAHSPAIARRKGLYEYRHYPLDPIRADVFAPLDGVDQTGREGEMLMWLSDVRYADEAAMAVFGADPGAEEKARILDDIEMIVDQSTTYFVWGENGRTFCDHTGDPAPQGPARQPTYGVFFRQRGDDQAAFRAGMTALAQRWAQTTGVLRVRLALFETPDIEAERKGGYPIKTHPLERQYQAWIDLVVNDAAVTQGLLSQDDAALFRAVHAYPAPAVYTFNYKGAPTLSGLRGYPAVEAIRNLGAEHQRDRRLLTWMYGEVAAEGPSA